jgi:hypothetical protein
MFARILCALLLCCAHFGAKAEIVFAERGDAGGFGAAQDVVGTAVERITGTIGGSDMLDVFRFYFTGGPLAIGASLDGSGEYAAGWLNLSLVSERSKLEEACFAGDSFYPPNPCVGTGWLNFSTDGLAAGNYLLGVDPGISADLAPGSPFTIRFMASIDANAAPANVSAPVPEPGALALVALGLLAIWRCSIPLVARPQTSRLGRKA